MSTDDLELIRDYAAEGSQAAFTALVNRHVDLVYSAAQRQVRSPDLAEEVTQSVFIALARHGHQLKPGTPLAAWLYLVTRRAAIDIRRRESRRQAREQTAYEIAAMKSNSSEWPQVEPLLDEAMEALAETDRSAILLRYFENKSLREVGRMLGTSDDAAQKRVSRALEQLRAFFSKRGVAVGATALAADLAAGAVQTAPIGLGLAISSATAITGVVGQVAVIEAARTLAMTSIQKALIVITLAAAVGAGLYERRVITRRNDQMLELQQQVEHWRSESRRLQRERDELTGQLAATRQEAETARSRITGEERILPNGDPAMEAELKAVFARVTMLKERLPQYPDQQIPELRLLKDQDWINVATKHKLDTDEDIWAAFSDLRTSGTINFADLMSKALWKYTQANDGQLPADILLLTPYFESPIEPEMLQRYGIMRPGGIREASQETSVIAEIAPSDGNQDPTLYMSGPRTQMNQNNINIHSGSYSDISNAVLGAVADFIKARGERPLTDPSQLAPYLKSPIDPARLQGFWTASGLPNNLHYPRD